MTDRPAWWALAAGALLCGCSGASTAGEMIGAPPARECAVELVVLGAGQDAGAPQIGNARDDLPRLFPTSIAVIDHTDAKRFLFEATPAITPQVHALDRIAPPDPVTPGGLGLDGVFVTHAHIGHYLGLAQFGRESAGARGQRVFAMPRMARFLRANGPWSQLVELGNIEIMELADQRVQSLTARLDVRPFIVPHRDEYSETVGYLIRTPSGTAVFVPDLDSWEEWEAEGGDTLEALLTRVEYAFIDATFYDDNELGGRDMSAIPHPRVKGTMERLAHLPASERAKVRFIHYNHTNPVRDPASEESAEVVLRGFHVARRGDRHCLDASG